MEDTDIAAIVWLAAAATLGTGEIMIAGAFYLAPFAVGALAAAILSIFGVSLPLTLIAFIVVSLLAFAALRPLARKLSKDYPSAKGIGANRLLQSEGVVIETIPASPTETGLIKIGGELWRAESEGHVHIAIDSRVEVTEVTGTRLTVKQINTEATSAI